METVDRGPVDRLHDRSEMTLRRLLGLFAFPYVSLHFLVWLVVDHFFAWREIGADIVKRPYLTVGLSALVLLILLAATSTAGMVKRLGALRAIASAIPARG